MTEREFWTIIRTALLMFVSAIEKKYMLGKHDPLRRVAVDEQNSIEAKES